MAGREPLELSIGVRFLGGLPIYAPSSSGPGYPALIREVGGQHPSGRREHSPTARGGRLKPGLVRVGIPLLAPARVAQLGRGNRSRACQVSVRIAPRVPVSPL